MPTPSTDIARERKLTTTLSLLPVVERELQVAARKRSTFWVRVAAALVALGLGGGFLILAAVSLSGFGPAMLGRGLFGALTWLSLAAVLGAGLFLTSDCLSEEKREGTLGLLFLTSLRGYDIVLGKLLATSLRSIHALLAVVPVLAITLLMGGVTGLGMARTSLALVIALLASLACGLFVSALSRNSQKAMVATLVLLVLWAGAGPAADGILAGVRKQPNKPRLSLTSPVWLFVVAGGGGQPRFWGGLLVNAAVTGLLLASTSVAVRHTWQQRPAARSGAGRSWVRWWRFGGSKRRAALRRRLLDINPVLWLACRERWQAASLWILAIFLAGSWAVIFATGERWVGWFVWGHLAGLVTVLLYLGAASEGARLFLDARRSGLLELVLSTPLSGRQILEGHWRAWFRLFGMPLVLCLATLWLGAVLTQYSAWSQTAAIAPAPPTPTAVTNATTTTNLAAPAVTTRFGVAGLKVASLAWVGLNPQGILVPVALASASFLTVAANLVALGWYGMWMGLNSKSTNLATLKTVLFVQIIPWFFIMFASVLSLPLFVMPMLRGGGQMIFWYPIVTTAMMTLLCLAKDAFFILYAKGKLNARLRAETRQNSPRVLTA